MIQKFLSKNNRLQFFPSRSFLHLYYFIKYLTIAALFKVQSRFSSCRIFTSSHISPLLPPSKKITFHIDIFCSKKPKMKGKHSGLKPGPAGYRGFS